MSNKIEVIFYLIKITMIISVTVSTCVPALLTTGERRIHHIFISNSSPTFVGDIHIDCNHDMTETNKEKLNNSYSMGLLT